MHLEVLIQVSNNEFDTRQHKTGSGVLNPQQQRLLRSKFNDQTCQLLSPLHNKWKMQNAAEYKGWPLKQSF